MPVQKNTNTDALSVKDLFGIAMQMQGLQLDKERLAQQRAESMQMQKYRQAQMVKWQQEQQALQTQLANNNRTRRGALEIISQQTGIPIDDSRLQPYADTLTGMDAGEVRAFLDKFQTQYTYHEGEDDLYSTGVSPVTGNVDVVATGIGQKPDREAHARQKAKLLARFQTDPQGLLEESPTLYNEALIYRAQFEKELTLGRNETLTQGPQGDTEKVVESFINFPQAGTSPSELAKNAGQLTKGARIVTTAARSRKLSPKTLNSLEIEMGESLNTLQDLSAMIEQLSAKPESLTAQQTVASFMSDMYARFFDPEFDPNDYKGMLEDFVKNAPNSSDLIAQINRHFQINYRKPVTGAQASMEELRELQRQYLSGDIAPWKFVAKAGGIMAGIRRRLTTQNEIYSKNDAAAFSKMIGEGLVRSEKTMEYLAAPTYGEEAFQSPFLTGRNADQLLDKMGK